MVYDCSWFNTIGWTKLILEIFLFLSYEGWVCESVHKGFMKIHGIVIGTIFYETKTRISDFMSMSHIYGNNGVRDLKCGLKC